MNPNMKVCSQSYVSRETSGLIQNLQRSSHTYFLYQPLIMNNNFISGTISNVNYKLSKPVI